MVVHSIGEGKEVLDVKGVIIQVFHWILDGDGLLSRTSVHWPKKMHG